MMSRYRYSAFAATGDVITGNIEACSQADALKLIHDRGMLAFEAVEAKAPEGGSTGSIRDWFSRHPSLASRVALTRSLATLLNADIVIDQSLRILAESNPKPLMRAIIEHCAESLAAGQTLSEALRSSKSGFRPDEFAMLAAGEENGSLARVSDQLARLLERRLELNHRLLSALIYPALLLVMAAASIFVIITVLIPNIEPLFEGNGAQMPVVVSLLLAIRDGVEKYWFVLAATLFAGLGGALALVRSPALRPLLDRIVLKLPFAGELVRQSIVSRLCLTLATLLQSGVPLQQSLAAVTHVAHNRAARQIVDHALEQVVTGNRLSRSLSGNALFDEPSLRLVALGEETNRLHQMLHHIAATGEAHVMRQVERAMTLLTPILTLVLGVMVGGIIMSVMQAILSINEIAIR